MRFRGVFACIPTPFDHRGEIYPAKVRHNISRWDRTALSGYLAGGYWGEGPALSFSEKSDLWRQVAEAVSDGKTLIADVSAESVRESAALAATAADAGFHAVLARPPEAWGAALSAAQARLCYFRTLADQSPLPLIVDGGHPGRPAVVPADMAGALSLHPQIVAYRDPSGDVEACRQVKEAAEGRLAVLAGDVRCLPACLGGPADAALLEFAATAPFFCLSIEEAIRTREIEAARDLVRRASEAVGLIREVHGVAGLKFAADLRGYFGGDPRLPLVPLRGEGRQRIERALREIPS